MGTVAQQKRDPNGLLNPSFGPTKGYEDQAPYEPWMTEDLSEKNPLPWQKYFGADAEKDVNDQLGRAFGSTYKDGSIAPGGYIDKTMNYGVAKTAAPLRAAPMGSNSGTSNSTTEALARKYSGVADNKLKALQINQKQAESKNVSKQLGMVGNELGAIDKLKMANFKEQYAYQQARNAAYTAWKNGNDAASAGIWGQIASAAGQFAGAAAAGSGSK